MSVKGNYFIVFLTTNDVSAHEDRVRNVKSTQERLALRCAY